ncbi:tRNA pseudouridine(65) synthase TruC [Ferrimonas balearica]|uniref:tRNA pseudouridine(65) synthase TruC n=1 Tax=Ferrimonas balearica TaxID=44012 RepID=UPI001C9A1B2D|nr:tRNA pseudouridine(65) synthase TruC [Ferrimonas balearica]MBY5990649.1 tRNA pseudouridine(65) synthase TruC [Ferrimonas balearica]
MIEILYEDDHLVAVHKPSGLLVHRSWLDRHETQFAMQMTRDLVGCHVFPVHRLDRPTSGVLLFTKSAETANALMEQMVARTVEKRYLALVRGYVDEAGELDYPLKRELDDIADKRANPDQAPQEAVTRYRPLARVELPFEVGRYPTARYTLMAMEPLTGRKHQLRRHMAHLRHPIIGDTTHGDRHHNKFYRAQFGRQRLWLMNKAMGLDHPVSGERLWLEAPMEAEWLALFERFGWPTSDDAYLSRSWGD